MRKIAKFLFTGALCVFLLSCNNAKEAKKADFNVIPLPNEITQTDDAGFTFDTKTKIVYPEGNDKMKQNAEFLSEYFATALNIRPNLTDTQAKGNNIVLQLGLDSNNSEAYRLEVTKNGITITGASEAGVFYGIQTLRKATPLDAGEVAYPAVVINDAPRFGYRGIHLDVARHFFPADFIKKYIDILALHNVNRFHWHLTEDQGWRIEIKKYPKLTEIGSKRKETVIGRNSGEYDGKPHGGFYTQEEIKEIVKYAEARYITIIPEIDLPGHMLAALAAYPEYGCTGGPYEVETKWGIFDDVLCPGKEETFTFLEDVLSEVIELFPSEYIHIGGDECPKVRWEKCPLCQRKIRELGLKDDAKHKKEFYLQSYVTERVEKFLNDHGRQIIGWDEILEGKLAPNATVMSWRGVKGGIEAAKMNHDVIMTPNTYAYFDYYQTANVEEEPLAIGGYLPIKTVYSYEPVPQELTADQKKHILGAQANVWTEYMPKSDHVEYMLLPRLAALSEVQWTKPELKNYDDFINRLPRLTALYDKLSFIYATHIFDIQASYKPNFDKNTLDITLSTIDNAKIYYTLDGSEPTANSTLYDGVVSIDKDADFKAIAIRDTGKNSKVLHEKVNLSASTFKPVTLLTKPVERFTYDGAQMLVDGIYGGSNYNSGRWLGFLEEPLKVVIDLLQATEISQAEIHTNVKTGDWVFDAQGIKVEVSDDNASYKEVVTQEIKDSHTTHWEGVEHHEVKFDPVSARYFKVTVYPVSSIPAWHGAKGKRGYLFVDEIILK